MVIESDIKRNNRIENQTESKDLSLFLGSGDIKSPYISRIL